MLSETMRRWAELPYAEKRIGLTGGMDTRTVLAAAVKAGLTDVLCVTGETSYLSWADRHLPPKLAASVGFRHEFERTGPSRSGPDNDRREAVRILNDDFWNHPSFARFADGGYDQSDDPNAIQTEGHVVEVGRCYYWWRLGHDASRPLPAEDLLRRLFRRRPEPYSKWVEALELWRETLSDETSPAIDWRDRFYLDQRLGSWFSQVHRTYDLIDRALFYPANSLWAVHRMLEQPVAIRRKGKAQMMLIKDMSPTLARFPVNPRPLPQQIKRTVRRFARKLLYR